MTAITAPSRRRVDPLLSALHAGEHPAELRPPGGDDLDHRQVARLGPPGGQQPADEGGAHVAATHDDQPSSAHRLNVTPRPMHDPTFPEVAAHPVTLDSKAPRTAKSRSPSDECISKIDVVLRERTTHGFVEDPPLDHRRDPPRQDQPGKQTYQDSG